MAFANSAPALGRQVDPYEYQVSQGYMVKLSQKKKTKKPTTGRKERKKVGRRRRKSGGGREEGKEEQTQILVLKSPN